MGEAWRGRRTPATAPAPDDEARVGPVSTVLTVAARKRQAHLGRGCTLCSRLALSSPILFLYCIAAVLILTATTAECPCQAVRGRSGAVRSIAVRGARRGRRAEHVQMSKKKKTCTF
jgi:hypothetical protein